MQAFVPILRPVMRTALGVFLPQPSPNSITHLHLHLREHLFTLRVVEVPDPAACPLIDPSHNCFRFSPERVTFRFFAYCRQSFATAFRARLTMVQTMPRLRPRPHGLIPGIAFGREPSHSTDGTFTRVVSGFPSALLKTAVGILRVQGFLNLRAHGCRRPTALSLPTLPTLQTAQEASPSGRS